MSDHVFPQATRIKEPGEPAFVERTEGLTKRELFAAMNMASFHTNEEMLIRACKENGPAKYLAACAVEAADALIAKLAEGK